ncbi:MAG: hypothetical protein EBZ24_14780 [Synechococcaceae bacterium WB9_4xB_025]|nr:hypothetical protein [Synechococcaceae bacterium WB9_4xB_025]
MAEGTWVPYEQLLKQLHISERAVRDFRAQGIFLPGEHYYRVGNGTKNGRLVFHLEGCRKSLLKLTVEVEKKAKAAKAVTYDKEYLDELIQEVH